MKGKSFLVAKILFMGVFILGELSLAAEEHAEEMKIINRLIVINDFERVKPDTLTSKPGTTVIWVNHSRFPVEILFLDKKVVLACGSPVNFFVGKDGAYESTKIPSGATASLCFTEKGRYEYQIKPSGNFYVGNIKGGFQGIILIE